jgi:hypothetical protein
MLYWLSMFSYLFILSIFCLFFVNYSLIFFLLNSELVVVILFFLFLVAAITQSINTVVGLGLCYLILGGMELALSLLIIIC